LIIKIVNLSYILNLAKQLIKKFRFKPEFPENFPSELGNLGKFSGRNFFKRKSVQKDYFSGRKFFVMVPFFGHYDFRRKKFWWKMDTLI